MLSTNNGELEVADWSHKLGYHSEDDAIQAMIKNNHLYSECFILSSIMLRED